MAGGCVAGAAGRALACVAAAELFLYMFGLADNDVCGVASDDRTRPVPAGEISLAAARVARAVCLVLGLAALAPIASLPVAVAAVGLVLTILAYNRTKHAGLMGACRGVAVLLGAAAVSGTAVGKVVPLALGITGYIVAVTLLSEGEERESEGLGERRYLLGLAALLPLLQLWVTPLEWFYPLMGCLAALVVWCGAVCPLWMAHPPVVRKRAVGQAIGATLYLQLGFMLPRLVWVAMMLIVASRLIKHWNKHITGS